MTVRCSFDAILLNCLHHSNSVGHKLPHVFCHLSDQIFMRYLKADVNSLTWLPAWMLVLVTHPAFTDGDSTTLSLWTHFALILCSDSLCFSLDSCTSGTVWSCLVVELQAQCFVCVCVCVLLTEWKELLFVAHIHHLTVVSNKAQQKSVGELKRRN